MTSDGNLTCPGTVTAGATNPTSLGPLTNADSRTGNAQAPNMQTLRRDRGHVCAEDYLYVDTAHSGTDICAALTAAVQSNPLTTLTTVALCQKGTYTAYTPCLIDRPTDFDGSGSKIIYDLPAGTQATVSSATLTIGSRIVTVSGGLPAGLAKGMRIGGAGLGPGNYVKCVHGDGTSDSDCTGLTSTQFAVARQASYTTAGIVSTSSANVTYLRNTKDLAVGQTFTWQGQTTGVAISSLSGLGTSTHYLTLASTPTSQGNNPTVLTMASGNTLTSTLYAVQATPLIMAVRNGTATTNQDGYNEGLSIHGLTIVDPEYGQFDASNKFPLFPSVAGEAGILVSGWDWWKLDHLSFDGIGGAIITLGGPDQVIPTSTYGYSANHTNWDTDYPAREGRLDKIDARTCGDWQTHQACIEVSTPAQASSYTDEDNGITIGSTNIDYLSAEGIWIGSYRTSDFGSVGPRSVHSSPEMHIEGGSTVRGESGSPHPYDIIYATEGQDLHFIGAQLIAPGQGRYILNCGACGTTVNLLGGTLNVYGNPYTDTVQLSNGSSTVTYVSGGPGKFDNTGILDDQGVTITDGASCTTSAPCTAWLAPSGAVSTGGSTLQLAAPWTGATTTTGTLTMGYGGGVLMLSAGNSGGSSGATIQVLQNSYYDNHGANLGALLMGFSSKSPPTTPGFYPPSLDVDLNGYRNFVYNNLNIQGGINLNGITQIKSGANTVYRCTTAGTLPVGALTTVSGNCGASVSTSFQVP